MFFAFRRHGTPSDLNVLFSSGPRGIPQDEAESYQGSWWLSPRKNKKPKQNRGPHHGHSRLPSVYQDWLCTTPNSSHTALYPRGSCHGSAYTVITVSIRPSHSDVNSGSSLVTLLRCSKAKYFFNAYMNKIYRFFRIKSEEIYQVLYIIWA